MKELSTEVIFAQCPVCKESKVEKIISSKFFGFLNHLKIVCSHCNARFAEKGRKDGEDVYRLDLSDSNLENKYKGTSLKISEWNRGISDLDLCIKTNSLPKESLENSKIVLATDENLHYHSRAELMEERAVRRTYGSAVRVMNGVYIGSSESKSHGELKRIDDGELFLTNKRIIFNGHLRSAEYNLTKLVTIEEHLDSVEIGISNRQKLQRFVVSEPHKLAVFLRIASEKRQKPTKS